MPVIHNADNRGTKSFAPALVTLTDGASVPWDVTDKGVSLAKVTIGGNRSLVISGMQAGSQGTLWVTQDGIGSRTLSLPSPSKVVGDGNGVIPFTTTPGAVDIINFIYDGTTFWWTYGPKYT